MTSSFKANEYGDHLLMFVAGKPCMLFNDFMTRLALITCLVLPAMCKLGAMA